MAFTPTEPALEIIFEDKQLLIINKPHNLLSQPDHTGHVSVQSLCKRYIEQQTGSNYLGLLHRLDRPATGLLMLAKTHQAASILSKQMRDHIIQKTYVAVVQGQPPANGMLQHYLLKTEHTNTVELTASSHADAKEASLSFRRKKQHGELALLEIHLQTGRTHQIRAQCAAEGYPLWGDYKYGRSQPDGRQMALQASRLFFNHPETNAPTSVEIPFPNSEPWNRLT